MILRINNDYFPEQHYQTGLCNRKSVRCLWGANSIFLNGLDKLRTCYQNDERVLPGDLQSKEHISAFPLTRLFLRSDKLKLRPEVTDETSSYSSSSSSLHSRAYRQLSLFRLHTVIPSFQRSSLISVSSWFTLNNSPVTSPHTLATRTRITNISTTKYISL
jgi:hypothetical protein